MSKLKPRKAKKPKKFNENAAVRSAMRRVFSRSPAVIESLKKVRRERPWHKKDGSIAKKPRVEYLCKICGDWYMGKDVQVDHRIPVVDPVKGFETWDIYYIRLFCGVDNLDVLCKSDHKVKTDEEKRIRAINRKLQKEKKEL